MRSPELAAAQQWLDFVRDQSPNPNRRKTLAAMFTYASGSANRLFGSPGGNCGNTVCDGKEFGLPAGCDDCSSCLTDSSGNPVDRDCEKGDATQLWELTKNDP